MGSEEWVRCKPRRAEGFSCPEAHIGLCRVEAVHAQSKRMKWVSTTQAKPPPPQSQHL